MTPIVNYIGNKDQFWKQLAFIVPQGVN